MNTPEALSHLQALARPGNLPGMARYGMSIERRLGVSMPDIRRLARQAGRDHRLALELWQTGIAEACILAALVDDPGRVTPAQMNRWVRGLDSWDICDQVCTNLFDRTPHAWQKIAEWSRREETFVRRAAFATLAGLAWHDRQAADERFIACFPILKNGATDERNFVKKAVNWALRQIGKRNRRLNRAALRLAREIQRLDSRAARWVAADAIRELERAAAQGRGRLR